MIKIILEMMAIMDPMHGDDSGGGGGDDCDDSE